jgi:hypothetical protein
MQRREGEGWGFAHWAIRDKTRNAFRDMRQLQHTFTFTTNSSTSDDQILTSTHAGSQSNVTQLTANLNRTATPGAKDYLLMQ